MNPIDSVNDFRGPLFNAVQLKLGAGLENQVVDLSVTSTAAAFDIKTLADGGTYDGHDAAHPELLNGGQWFVIQPSGSDIYFRLRSDNAAGVAAATGRLVKDGDMARVWVDVNFHYLDIVSVAAGPITVKTWYSNKFSRV